MITAPLVQIRAHVIEGVLPNLFWVGVSPWPSMPTNEDDTLVLYSWRCCPGTAYTGYIAGVELHLPRNAGDPAFTVTVDVDAATMTHLEGHHGFRIRSIA